MSHISPRLTASRAPLAWSHASGHPRGPLAVWGIAQNVSNKLLFRLPFSEQAGSQLLAAKLCEKHLDSSKPKGLLCCGRASLTTLVSSSTRRLHDTRLAQSKIAPMAKIQTTRSSNGRS
jgi:hypothetical protein